MTAWRTTFSLLLAFWLFQLLPAAGNELRDENILVSLPGGYKIGHQNTKDNILITEMIPSAETVENWTEMLTVQVFRGKTDTTLEAFEATTTKLWKESCPGSAGVRITRGTENGYPFDLWMLSCDLNKASGKPEITWFKAIQGADALYVVQRASRFQPEREQIVAWMKHLKEVRVCDTRRPESPCK